MGCLDFWLPMSIRYVRGSVCGSGLCGLCSYLLERLKDGLGDGEMIGFHKKIFGAGGMWR